MTKPAALVGIGSTLYSSFSYFDILPFFIEHKVLGTNVLEEARLEILEAVDFSICVNPTNGLREVAKSRVVFA